VPSFPGITQVSLPPLSYGKAAQGVVTNLTEEDLELAAIEAVKGIPQHLRSRFTFQIQQMPKVVHEILKYNPSITAENLRKRLTAFLGMHTRTGTDNTVGSSSNNSRNTSLPPTFNTTKL
jgi:hypothetical protein